eukprot:CAMPEP_0178439152 /NCGR_PEP_ID=MMETSP0689_2-20121128/35997_1 /TAXON_ID=160604 /ORGANISM="Amphidinium massartii, Strain CS-259" /LENGTH=65 /DNA_ID=CAMNT_0020061649 /DNA_START=267 /DNA_END=464 /DNA_ORIENTATION=+
MIYAPTSEPNRMPSIAAVPVPAIATVPGAAPVFLGASPDEQPPLPSLNGLEIAGDTDSVEPGRAL